MKNRDQILTKDIELRNAVQDTVLPIITIAKENMVSNCYKNEEIKEIHEDVVDLKNRMADYEKTLNNVNLF